MTLKPVTNIPGRKTVNSNLIKTLEEFMMMEAEAVEIDPIKEGYKHANSLQTTILAAIKTHGYKNKIAACQRNGKVYLIKINLTEEIEND